MPNNSHISLITRSKAESIRYSASLALVSICNPGQPAPELRYNPGAYLHLEFSNAIPGACPEFSPFPDSHLSLDDAAQVVEFARSLPARIKNIYVHCDDGGQRAAAVALYLQAETGARFLGEEMADRANRHVVALLEKVSGLSIEIPSSSQTLLYLSCPGAPLATPFWAGRRKKLEISAGGLE